MNTEQTKAEALAAIQKARNQRFLDTKNGEPEVKELRDNEALEHLKSDNRDANTGVKHTKEHMWKCWWAAYPKNNGAVGIKDKFEEWYNDKFNSKL